VFDEFQPPVHLLQRAERAEQELRQVREQAAETLREAQATSRETVAGVEQLARTADAANRRSTEAMQQLQQVAHTLNETIRQNDAALTEQARRSDEAQHAAHVAQHAARQAREQAAAMLNSTSWRVTAPLRMVRRMLPSKQLARRVFHRGARLLLGLPGGQRSVRLVRAIAPGKVEWLARRYRAYEQVAAHQVLAASTVTPPVTATDLSHEEARLYRQLVTANPGVATSV
ncbi:MAG: hypothetical protein ACREXZ_30565, partial [Paraburkholderia sp.]